MEYSVVRKNIKNLYLRVKTPDGSVVVSAPRHISSQAIDEFVQSRIRWIERQRERIFRRASLNQQSDLPTSPLFLWGKPQPLLIQEGTNYALDVSQDTLVFTQRKGCSTAQLQNAWRHCLRELFSKRVEERLPLWEAYTGLQASEWRPRFMKTRWGSCVFDKRRIWLNVRLIHYPPECLDYVIVHELIHLQVRNHGAAFYELLNRYYPSWLEAKALLKS